MLYPVELRARRVSFYVDQARSVESGRGREIRTPDILLPKQARYQTALYPDIPRRREFDRLRGSEIILGSLSAVKRHGMIVTQIGH